MNCGRSYTKNRISYHGEWMVRIPCQSHWSNYSSKWKLREILTMYILEMCIVINFLWIFLFLKLCIWLGLCEMVKNGCKVIYKIFDPTHKWPNIFGRASWFSPHLVLCHFPLSLFTNDLLLRWYYIFQKSRSPSYFI